MRNNSQSPCVYRSSAQRTTYAAILTITGLERRRLDARGSAEQLLVRPLGQMCRIIPSLVRHASARGHITREERDGIEDIRACHESVGLGLFWRTPLSVK